MNKNWLILVVFAAICGIFAMEKPSTIEQKGENVDWPRILALPDPAQREIASGMSDEEWRSVGEVLRFVSQRLTVLQMIPITERVDLAGFSPDGSKIMVVSDKLIRVSDVATGNLVSFFRSEEPIEAVQFSEDGRRVLVIEPDRSGMVRTILDISHSSQPPALISRRRFAPGDFVDLLEGRWVELEKPRWDSRISDMRPMSKDSAKVIAIGPSRLYVVDVRKYESVSKILETFIGHLNLSQFMLLLAFDQAMKEKKRIQATPDQWETFMTFPAQVREALKLYIRKA